MTKKILILILIFFMLFDYVEAESSLNLAPTGNQTDISGNGGTSVEGLTTIGGKEYYYKFKRFTSASGTIYVGIYNKNGESIMNNKVGRLDTDDKFYSGTSAGINIKQESFASWAVSNFNFALRTWSYECVDYKTVYIRHIRKCENSEGSNCGYYYTLETQRTVKETNTVYLESDIKCSNNYEVENKKEIKTDVPDSNIFDSFKRSEAIHAKSIAEGMMTKNGSISFISSNSYDKNNMSYITSNGILTSSNIVEDSEYSGHRTDIYIYKPSGICIDIRTGNVTYKTNCDDDEVKVTDSVGNDGNTFWHYFIPLNFPSSDNKFNLIFKSSSDKELKGSQCQKMIEDYPEDYSNYLVLNSSGQQLNNDYCINGTCGNKTTSSDYNKVKNGCYLTVNIKLPVVQKFYFEEIKDNQAEYNGYNFYYRSINISNPFPNPPKNNSWWISWYNNYKTGINNQLDISKSFSKVSYSVNVTNDLANDIRLYNKNNPYPLFDSIGLDGRSKFVRSNSFEIWAGETNYKLGAGTGVCITDGVAKIGSDC